MEQGIPETLLDVEIVRGCEEDLPELASINEEIFTGVYDVEPFTLDDYRTRLHRVRPLVLIAKSGGEIIGNSIAFPHENTFFIWVIGVKEKYRRRGIATRLFAENETHAKNLGHKTIMTKVYHTSEPMMGLVTKLGYSVIRFTNEKLAKDTDGFHYKIRKNLQ